MLDRSKPLWELWLLTGLASGRVAHVWKIHHSVADGSACARILELAYQHSPEERAVEHEPAADEPHIGEDDMSLRGVLHRHAFRTRHLPAVLRQSRIAIKSSRALQKQSETPSQKLLTSPKTRYNYPLTLRRTTAAASLSMEDIKKVRAAFDVSVNDVFLAVCGGAVRRHLEANGELDTKSSMSATVPVSVRRDDEAAEYGNRTIFWGVCLNSTMPEPVERLLAIKASTKAARMNQNREGADGLLREWQDYPPLFKALNQVGVVSSKIAGRPAYNMVVSNVKGPSELWADGARVEEIASIGQLTTGIGLNMTGWSYCGAMTIGLVACPEHEPTIWALADQLEAALAELVAAADHAMVCS
jgi:WS/DGAT/MGAT family acyltransferase